MKDDIFDNVPEIDKIHEVDLKERMEGDMAEMLEHVSLSVDNAKLFKQESQQLANNVASLNSVYGNMLSVVNNN